MRNNIILLIKLKECFGMTKDKKEQFICINEKRRKFMKDNKISIPIDHDKVNDIAERLLNENVDFVKNKNLKMEV